jgi:PIN domain nuclease of toxin-antitoxin system
MTVQGFHKDPADQIIVATSIISGIPLLTAEQTWESIDLAVWTGAN